jgi:hypothetical protein
VPDDVRTGAARVERFQMAREVARRCYHSGR